MFEKFTERAVVIITTAQDISIEMKHTQVCPEHVLLALCKNNSGICTKLFKLYNITYDKLYLDVQRSLYDYRALKQPETTNFSKDSKKIFEKASEYIQGLSNKSVQTEYIFLALLKEDYNVRKLLSKYNFNFDYAIRTLSHFLPKKEKSQNNHPENAENGENIVASTSAIELLDKEQTRVIFENALSKLATKGYEILGTEQIVQSILDSDSDLNKLLNNFGITLDKYNECLKNIQSREDEFCGRQIIFTPNAFKAVILGIEKAKETGSTELKPEHILLGILQNKSGIAYNILKSFNIDEENLIAKIEKSVEKTMNETLMILQFAKEEAFRVGTNIVGTEMILLGIIIESYGAGARTLGKLGITLKDARNEIAKIIGTNSNEFETDSTFSRRAKKVLELAWEFAQKYNKKTINSEDLLMGIASVESSVAMQVLFNLGTDTVEIKQGILNELNS